MGKTNFQHDIAVIDASGTEIGLTLWKNAGGVPQYSETVDPSLPQQLWTGDVDYGKMNPERELVLVQSDFRGGCGLEYQDATQPKRYFLSLDVDPRFKDKIITAGAKFVPTLPTVTTLTITNAGMETASSGWTGGARTSDIAHGGTYSWAVGTNVTAIQNIASGTDYKEKSFTWGCWVYAETFTPRIAIADGAGTTQSSAHSGAAGWEWLAVTRTISADATKLELQLNSTPSAGGTNYFDDAAPASHGLGFIYSQCDFNDLRYVSCGNILLKQDADASDYTYVCSFPAVITQLYPATVAGVDYLFICLGWSHPYWYMTTAEVIAQTDLANSTAKYFALVGSTFYEADTNSTIRTTAAPLAGGTAWGTAIQVGDDYNDITCLLQAGGLAYIMKEDKPFYRNSSGVIIVLTDETVCIGGGSGGANSIVWQGGLWMPYGAQGLLRYDLADTSFAWMQPSLFAEGNEYLTGRIMALAGDDSYLYALVYYSTTASIIMTLRYEDVDGTSNWIWHSLQSMATVGTATSIYSLGITSVYRKRLWAGSNTYLHGMALTTKHGSIASDTDYTYNTAAATGLYTSWLHYNLRGDKKAFLKLTLTMSDTTTAIYWRAYYQKLGDGATWTEINSTGSVYFKTSPRTSGYLPADGSSVYPQTTMIRLKFLPVTNDSTKTPVLLGYDLRAIWYPTERKLISCQVKVEDALPIAGEQIDDQLGATIRTTLDNLNSSSWPRAFYPLYWASSADTVYIRKLPLPTGTPQLELVGSEKDKTLTWVYNLLLQVVPLS